jgi:hypothetical protein
MVGRGRRQTSRFADRKRPKKPAVELRELEEEKMLRLEGVFKIEAEAGSDMFKFCPKDGRKLHGRRLKCETCSAKWWDTFLVLNHENGYIHMVDERDFLKWWRKCVFRRVQFNEHNGVSWTSEPPVPFAAFVSIF